MLNQETAKAARTDSGYILRAPRRMRVADAVAQYMRVPMGAGNSVPWDPLVAPYVIEPMNCLASREYDAVIFVGPARTGKTIGLIDGWVIYNVICDPADMLIIQMTEEKAREHSKKRLARTFRVSPEVVSRLSPNKNDNNVYDRTFLAGNYLKIGWPSVNMTSWKNGWWGKTGLLSSHIRYYAMVPLPVTWQRRYVPDGVNGLSVRKSPGSLPVRCWNV